LEQKAKTPEGDSARWRPRRLAEEAPAAPLGKRSHLRKSTAVYIEYLNSKTFSVALLGEGDIILAENRNSSNLYHYYSIMSSYFFIRTKNLPIRLAIASSAKF
jgi:hypothetical protein